MYETLHTCYVPERCIHSAMTMSNGTSNDTKQKTFEAYLDIIASRMCSSVTNASKTSSDYNDGWRPSAKDASSLMHGPDEPGILHAKSRTVARNKEKFS